LLFLGAPIIAGILIVATLEGTVGIHMFKVVGGGWQPIVGRQTTVYVIDEKITWLFFFLHIIMRLLYYNPLENHNGLRMQSSASLNFRTDFVKISNQKRLHSNSK